MLKKKRTLYFFLKEYASPNISDRIKLKTKKYLGKKSKQVIKVKV